MRSRWTAVLVAVVMVGAMLVLGAPSGAASATGTVGAQAAPAVSPWVSVSLGFRSPHTCAVRADHTGWCWGLGVYGELGNGTFRTQVTHPEQVPGTWSVIKVSGDLTCGVQTDATGWCWGDNQQGQVGSGGSLLQASPFQLPGHWLTISPGYATSCGVQTDGSGWCWGVGSGGEIGDGNRLTQRTPARVPGTWSIISSHEGTTCGVRVDSTGWCWGGNLYAQVGDGTRAVRPSPTQLPGLWTSISRGYVHTCGIKVDQTGWCWGGNWNGVVGDGTQVDRLTPFELPGHWRRLRVDEWDTCGVTTDGQGWCWGNQTFGQVGNGVISVSPRTTPQALPASPGSWDGVQPNVFASCGIKTTGDLLCWGSNYKGGLGVGMPHHFAIRATPQRVRPLLHWTTLTLRVNSVGGCAIRDDGTLWCWGDNSSGQLGDGTTIIRDRPVLVTSS